ncbi:lipopolysaccharide biosynthesis protein [Marinisporobacter balticus]|uniref:O-antigen/teichoic acid export membrane protein n=1 Tax=Marinisporobacter balticus TaxID=2018667 RepID=A0A4R2L4D5_9FIRM|nr:oligosaccharide flippase family protein [Marinisporobacter balticus]TCO78829.1 O-antigen/teichoic acid export membrane protein [Marinisporobacter balticus]
MISSDTILEFLIKRKGFIIFTLLKVLIMILGLITNVVIVRKLSVGDYGIFSLIFMLIGLITTFGFSWSSSSILYYGSKEKAKHGSINKTFWARSIIIFLSLIIITLLFLIFGKQINLYVGLNVSFLILIWLYVSVAEDYLSQYFLAVNKQVLSTLLSITAKIIYLLLISTISFDVKTLLVINIISHASVIFYIFKIDNKDVGRFEFDRLWFKEVLNFSLWQLFGFSGLYLINFGDTAVIKHFMTTEDVGIYNAAYKLFTAIAGFAYLISSYYATNVSSYFLNRDYNKINIFFYKERLIIFSLSIIVHMFIIAFSKLIIITIYGVRYLDAVKIFNVLMIGSMFNYLSVFYVLYYNTNDKYKILQTLNIIQALVNLGLDVIFINFFGLIGPAIATTIAMLSSFLFSFLYCEKKIRNNSCEIQ